MFLININNIYIILQLKHIIYCFIKCSQKNSQKNSFYNGIYCFSKMLSKKELLCIAENDIVGLVVGKLNVQVSYNVCE